MEKITQEMWENKMTNVHNFYCDECGAHFAISKEFDNGYYYKSGCVDVEVNTPYGRYKTDKCLCGECKGKFISNVCKTLESMGFSK